MRDTLAVIAENLLLGRTCGRCHYSVVSFTYCNHYTVGASGFRGPHHSTCWRWRELDQKFLED